MANKYAHLKKRGKHSTRNWLKGCMSKKRYSSRIADLVIEKKRGEVQLYKYYCGACDSYHLTRTKQP